MTVAIAGTAHPEVAEWIADFRTKLAKDDFGFTAIIHSLVQLGVESPEVCDCDIHEGACSWIHQNHRAYNRMIWGAIMLIRPEVMPKLRRVVQGDLRKLSVTEDEERARWLACGFDLEGFRFIAYGQIARHDYEQALLDHFLWSEESKCSWI